MLWCPKQLFLWAVSSIKRKNMNEWWALRDSILLNEVDTRSKILESLRASYFHLSDDLKECILLCSFMEQGNIYLFVSLFYIFQI